MIQTVVFPLVEVTNDIFQYYSIQEACTKVSGMALINFNRTRIVAACIAFIEMIGQDSTTQKLHCHVASQLFAYNQHLLLKSSIEVDQGEGRLEKEIYDIMHKCVYSGRKSAAQDVLLLLEEATKWEIEKRRLAW